MRQSKPILHGFDHRPGGTDPIGDVFGCCPGEWITPTLESPWENSDDDCPFKYRWGPHHDGDTLAVAGLQFTGKVQGGDSESLLFTLPAEDRPDCTLDGESLVLDEDDVPVDIFAYRIAPSGAVTVVWPVIEAGGGDPSGPAGGVLDGTYPDPGLAASVAGSGLSESSDVLAVNVDGSTLEISSDALRVKDGGITAAKMASGVLGLEASKNSSDVTAAKRNRLNFIEGSGIALTVADDSAGDEVEVTIAATGGGGGGAGVGVTEEKAHVEITSDVTVTSTTEGSPTTIAAMSTDLTVDGATALLVEFFARDVQTVSTSGGYLILNLQASTNSGSSWSDIGRIGAIQTPAANVMAAPVHVSRRLTPAAGTVRYRIVGWGSASGNVVQAGAGGAATGVPAFLRVTAATSTGSSALVPLYDSTLAADAASFDVTGLSGSYAHLLFVLDARGAASATSASVYLRLNGDSGSNYDYEWIYGLNVGGTAGQPAVLQGLAQAQMLIGDIPAATATSGRSGVLEGKIPNYAGATFNKNVRTNAGFARGTANGDVFVETSYGVWRSAAAVNRLTFSLSSGNFLAGTRLTIYGIAASGGAGSPPGLVLIEDKLLVASAASLDFTSIPSGYKGLKLIVQARSDKSAATNDWLFIRANNDSGANYEIMHEQVFGTTDGLTENLTPTSIPWLSELPAASSPAGAVGSVDIEIPNYAGTTFWKTFHSTGGTLMQTSTGQVRHVESYGVWKNTAAINRITLAPTTGPNLIAGTRATLYGYN